MASSSPGGSGLGPEATGSGLVAHDRLAISAGPAAPRPRRSPDRLHRGAVEHEGEVVSRRYAMRLVCPDQRLGVRAAGARGGSNAPPPDGGGRPRSSSMRSTSRLATWHGTPSMATASPWRKSVDPLGQGDEHRGALDPALSMVEYHAAIPLPLIGQKTARHCSLGAPRRLLIEGRSIGNASGWGLRGQPGKAYLGHLSRRWPALRSGGWTSVAVSHSTAGRL